MKIETLSIHGAHLEKVVAPISPAIVLSSTFERDAAGALSGEYMYGRLSNPNREAVEQVLTQLEHGATALAFSSGLAAASAVFQTLQAGDHVVAPDDLYHGTKGLLRDIFGRWGLQSSFVDLTDVEIFRTSLRPETKLVWIETPSNPLLKITDIAAIANIARENGVVVAVDSTFATPILQKPLLLGADVVMHSATKYLGGHSDLTAGVLVFKSADAIFEKARQIQQLGGAVPSPFDCWLLQRGIQTLPLRVDAQVGSAQAIAEFLQVHPQIEAVHYSGLPSHPGHTVAVRQMSGFGAMLSFQVRGGEFAAARAVARVQLCRRATSLGGTETLIEHRFHVEGPHSTTPRNLVRLSVGIENSADIIADLDKSLNG